MFSVVDKATAAISDNFVKHVTETIFATQESIHHVMYKVKKLASQRAAKIEDGGGLYIMDKFE